MIQFRQGEPCSRLPIHLNELRSMSIRGVAVVAILALAFTQGSSACTLTHNQRLAYMQKAVQLLSPSASAPAGPEMGTFLVKARRYYDYSKSIYIPVKKVEIHEYNTWASQKTEWNSGSLNEFQLRLTNALVGKTYQVRVEWSDGESNISNFTMTKGGTEVVVEKPY